MSHFLVPTNHSVWLLAKRLEMMKLGAERLRRSWIRCAHSDLAWSTSWVVWLCSDITQFTVCICGGTCVTETRSSVWLAPRHKSICGPLCDESRRGSPHRPAGHWGFLWVLSNPCLCSSTINPTFKNKLDGQIKTLLLTSKQTEQFQCGMKPHDIWKPTTSCLGAGFSTLSGPDKRSLSPMLRSNAASPAWAMSYVKGILASVNKLTGASLS